MNLLLANDNALFREGLARIIYESLDHCKINQAKNWKQLHEYVSENNYDLMFLDAEMPGETSWVDELSLIRIIKPSLPICLSSSSGMNTNIEAAFELGIEGYLPRSFDIGDMEKTIKKLVSGDTVFPREKLQVKFTPTKLILTNRQLEIMNYVAAGNSSKLIARTLGLTEATVKRHLSNIYRALDVKNRLSAIRVCKRLGLYN